MNRSRSLATAFGLAFSLALVGCGGSEPTPPVGSSAPVGSPDPAAKLPKAEAKPAEAPKADAAKPAEAPKAEAKPAEAPKADAAKPAEAPKADAKPAAPKLESPK